MLNSEKEFLLLFGWDDFFESQVSGLSSSSLLVGRIVCEQRKLYKVQTGLNQSFWAAVTGKFQHAAQTRADFPAVGDWVAVALSEQSDRGVIENIFKRKTILSRKQAGETTDIQILSTNIDSVFITSSVNSDLNLRRIERYLAIAKDSGATPIILLTKADLCSENVNDVVAKVSAEFPGVTVHAISKNDFASADFLSTYLRRGTTSVFVGSSGVGKSTLVNFLTDDDKKIKTQEVRDDDEKGRHTTTSRNLYVSRLGGLIIDTPGMRELQLSDQDEGVQTQFSDVELLMQSCRFTDCAHQTEPGCAIKQALLEGSLSEEKWKSYLKLQAEVKYQSRKRQKGRR